MLGKFTKRFLAWLAVASAAVALTPKTARAQQPSAATLPVTTAPATDQTATDGGELQRVIVTGYIIPRIGDGPQPVTTLDQDFINKQADQTVGDVLQRLPQSIASLNPKAPILQRRISLRANHLRTTA